MRYKTLLAFRNDIGPKRILIKQNAYKWLQNES